MATLAAAIAGACATTGAGAALAQTGVGGGGGLGTPDPPLVKDVTCSVRCLDLRTVTVSGRIEITGTGLSSVTAVRFKGEEGPLDVKPNSASDTAVTATVPKGALSGKVSVSSMSGQKSASPVAIEIEPEDAIDEVDGFEVKEAEATPTTTFFDSAKGSELNYLFAADGPTDIRVDVVNKETGETVDSVVQEGQEPFANHTFSWNGLDADKSVARNGDYKFKVSQISGGPGAGVPFDYYDHIFPLRGKHYYGDGLGAGRGHQGQDVFAKCGTKIVAARGGRVQVNAYQSAAGYYLVIDGQKTGQDYVYMHMEQRGRPAAGTRVHTGDVIGYESDTGDASGCHLHFELWSAPGWYEGGHVLDPTTPLKKWDRYS
ncbi:MAG: peptidoglycan DD-metalloendopeptidase family protein [Solirubrobacterales bacterium]